MERNFSLRDDVSQDLIDATKESLVWWASQLCVEGGEKFSRGEACACGSYFDEEESLMEGLRGVDAVLHSVLTCLARARLRMGRWARIISRSSGVDSVRATDSMLDGRETISDGGSRNVLWVRR